MLQLIIGQALQGPRRRFLSSSSRFHVPQPHPMCWGEVRAARGSWQYRGRPPPPPSFLHPDDLAAW